ncbi:MAG: regulatory protein RecX [Clostridia bacterium]|nr:regulatory protein RecX [Clostridia bacterium]
MIIDDKVMKYVLFKKRTESEVRKKCQNLNYDEDYIEEAIDYLKEAGYINDKIYIQKYIGDIKKLKHLSLAQIKTDLIRRGVESDLVEDAISSEEMMEFEFESAQYLANKKMKSGEEIEKIKRFLLNKGYSYSNVLKSIDNLENIEDN